MGTFGATTVSVPRARVDAADGKTSEWHSKTLPAYQRRTKQIEALIAGGYLAGTNTRRVGARSGCAVPGAVSRTRSAGCGARSRATGRRGTRADLSSEAMVRLILDGTVVRVRLDRKATAISLLVALGVRADGQKVLLAVQATWAGKARRRGGRCSTILSNAA